MMRFIFAFLLLLLPTYTWAAVVPCVTPVNADAQLTREQKKRTFKRKVEGETQKWMFSTDNCIQQTHAQAVKTASMKISYEGLQKKWLNVNLELKNTKAMLREWETVRLPSWKERLSIISASLVSSNKQVVLWRGSAEKYRQMYLSQTPKWYQHPAFVAVVTALTTTAVLYAGSQIGRAFSATP